MRILGSSYLPVMEVLRRKLPDFATLIDYDPLTPLIQQVADVDVVIIGSHALDAEVLAGIGGGVTAGASLDAEAVTALLNRKEIRYLSEMMNYPGVLHQDQEVPVIIKTREELVKQVEQAILEIGRAHV